MCSGLAGGGEASCSGPRPLLLPHAYCKCVQDETPTRKHFLPVPVSGSASCECRGSREEFERAAFACVLSAGDHGGVGGMLQGVWAAGTGPLGLQRLVPLGCGSARSRGLRSCFWGALGCHVPEPHGVKVPVCCQVGGRFQEG